MTGTHLSTPRVPNTQNSRFTDLFTRTMLNNLEWQSKKQRIYMNTLVFIFKIKNNMAPDYLTSKLIYTREATTRVLRNADDYRLPRYNRTYLHTELSMACRIK
jgi:hypothetical protein